MKNKLLAFLLIASIIIAGCSNSGKNIEIQEGELFEGTFTVAGVGPEISMEPTVDEGTLVLIGNYEDHTDHILFTAGTWENFLQSENNYLPGNIINFKGIVEFIDGAAGNHYYNVKSIESLELINGIDNTNYQGYEGMLFIAGVGPEQSGEPAVDEGTLVLKQKFEDHTDHLFINEGWENYLGNESIIPGSTVAFKGTVEEIDAGAGNHYYDVKGFEELSFIYNEADTCNLDNDCLPENWFWNDILAELDNCNVTSVFQTHSLKVGATTKDGNTFESVEPGIDAIVKAAQAASEKCGYEIMIATE